MSANKVKKSSRQESETATRKNQYKESPSKCSVGWMCTKDRMTYHYHVIRNKLRQEDPLKKIAENAGVTRDTVYYIKRKLIF